jgi:hypothetical protein
MNVPDPPVIASPESLAPSPLILQTLPEVRIDAQEMAPTAPGFRQPSRWWSWPLRAVARVWDFICLSLLLAIVAAIPILQLASLGYVLNSAANLARRRPWSSGLPGLRIAGFIGRFSLCAAIVWLPVWLISDIAYSMQLLQPGTRAASLWRAAAFLSSAGWVCTILWAAMRGGQVRHFLWPAPIRFMNTIWRPTIWRVTSDRLYDKLVALRIPSLWWLGLRAAAGAIVWIAVPVSMMIIGQRATFAGAGLVGLVGALAMVAITLYLPFLQIQLAASQRFSALFQVSQVRARFRYAPLAHGAALLLLCLLSIPLYLLRIEATPAELVWAPSLVFVVLTLPCKILLGAAMGYADSRRLAEELNVRSRWLRWPGQLIALAAALIYVGALYIAQLVAGQGAFVMYFQHIFLVPAPYLST